MDIDIDLPPSFNPTDYFDVTLASMIEGGEIKKHPVGVYFQRIPVDKETGLSAIPYKKTEAMGFTKIDFLHLNLLREFKSKNQIKNLLKKEPNWTLLESKEVVEELFHIGRHFELVNKIQPKSVQEIADILALIRPGKDKLIEPYLKNPKKVRHELYTKRINSDMRKAHAVSYALLIVLQLHLVEMKNDNS